jgi:prepilin-type N-terminal cleavage/methylation domain-containing protein
MRSRHTGFTIIELLVVIAVIAILAAILFPVFAAARENVRKTTCMANMHDIWVGASVFQQDHNRWPCMLLGYAEVSNGKPWEPASPYGDPVPANQISHRFLYPNYVKSIESFHCPDNLDTSLTKVDSPDFPVNSPIYQRMKQFFGHT